MKKPNLALSLLATALLVSCGTSSTSQFSSKSDFSSSSEILSSSSIESSSSEISSSSTSVSEVPSLFESKTVGAMKSMKTLEAYTPTLFDAGSFKEESTKQLGDGVDHIVYSFKLSNGHKVNANVVKVDPTKANIRTTKTSSIATVNNQIVEFENEHPDVKVMAGVNADFFATGVGGASVNAYVKDGKIEKANHNDKGLYDYRNLNADIPASKPMLLGSSGDSIRIGPVNEKGTIEENIKTKFTYTVYWGKPNQEAAPIQANGVGINETKLNSNEVNLITHGSKFKSSKDDKLVRIKLIKSDGIFVYGKVAGIETCVGQYEATSTYYDQGSICLFVAKSSTLNFEKGDYIGYTVTSPDSNWYGYNNIIGGRQSLVENGEIASTVTLENSNAAQTSNIPRTCAGITPQGKLLLTTIEALRYGGTSSSNDDSYGVSLPELAQFMRYVGCYDALNFDGGGSTQLITSDNNGTGTKTLKVRSSDYGTWGVNDCRKILNTILITTK